MGCLLSCSKKEKEVTTSSADTSKQETQLAVFQKVSSQESGIIFANNLKEDVSTLENLFDFDYFYNGAGVGVVDINNDGLQDVFFTGNQVPNKLYLNKGQLQFEDISESAGINVGKQWSNGVTFADVNGDGWMDIYVAQGGPKLETDRKNLLYINQKDNSFRESADDYNLSDKGISTQSVFFDFDKDGDLDCIVSNENEFYGLDPNRFFKTLEDKSRLEKSSVQLYRNDGNRFTKITEQAGLLRPAFGLGITVSDLDNDGWLDIYVANDYYVPDALYINNKNGTFSERIKDYTKQVSFYGMGVDIADINNDNLQDIFVLDMAASDHVRSKTLMASMNESRFSLLVDELEFQHQYMFNSLQLNMGNNNFNNVVHQANVAKTDWSWAGLIVDLNNDAQRDIYVTNGYRRYALDNDIQNQIREAQRAFKGKVPLEVKQRLYNAMPTEKLSNVMYENTGDIHFVNTAYQWGLAVPSFSNGATYADLDNDGDLELLVNNIDDEAFLFKNTTVENKAGNFLRIQLKGFTSEPFAKIKISYGDTSQVLESKRTKGYLSATEDIAHFGLGKTEKIDKVIVQWLSGKQEERTNVAVNTTLNFEEKNAKTDGPIIFETTKSDDTSVTFKKITSKLNLDFKHKENTYNDFEKEVLLPYKQSTLGPFISKEDVNGDGLDDVFIGGASGQGGQLFVQTSTGFSKINNPDFDKDAIYEDMESLFVDLDNDNDKDLIVLSGGNEFDENNEIYRNRYYENDGQGNFKRIPDKLLAKHSSKSLSRIDYDKDGDQDIIIGNRIQPQHYPIPIPSTIYRNDNGQFTDVTTNVASELETYGIVNKVITTDFDSDGWEDFIVVGEWSHIGMFRNGNGVFKDVSGDYGLDTENGWWFTIKETDLNKDGLPDYIVGNIGTNIKYKATIDKPFKVFGEDFDDNGTFDLVLSNAYNGNYVPARGKECSTQQMPFISEKFTTYNAFANATLKEIYGEKLETAYQREITTFASKVLLNTGSGFKIMNLPVLAQMAPILSIETADLNDDGFDDLIVAGNIYETEVETPRYDMGNGLVLLSNGEDTYTAVHPKDSELYIDGNVKNIVTVDHSGLEQKILLAAINDGTLGVYQINQ